MLFSCDASGNVVSVNFNGTDYYYVRNGQGDIIKLLDGSGATVTEYTYDTWGKLVTCTGSLSATPGALNPFRYRGYVYDNETGFYYLQSRYYDPEVCRFLSADVLLSTGQGVLGHNTFAYCLNNPVMMYDANGHCSYFLFIKIKDCGRSDCITSREYNGAEVNPFSKAKYVVENSNIPIVLQQGMGASAAFGAQKSLALTTAFDAKGNTALFFSSGAGGGSPSAGVYAITAISYADSVDSLQGIGGTMGGSGNVYYCLTGGLEYTYGLDSNDHSTHTISLQAGTSVKCPAPAEIHGGVVYTIVVFKFNIFDLLGRAYDAITGNLGGEV